MFSVYRHIVQILWQIADRLWRTKKVLRQKGKYKTLLQILLSSQAVAFFQLIHQGKIHETTNFHLLAIAPLVA